jgi:hypothetical protein
MHLRTMSKTMSVPFVSAAVLGAVGVPLLVFLLSGLLAGMAPGEVVGALVEQSRARTSNPLKGAMAGLVPMVVLLGTLAVAARFDRDRTWLGTGRWVGLGSVLLVIAWANFEYWPTFLPDRVYAGFPHGLELVIGPIFFAPVAMAVALVATRIMGRHKG